MAKDIRVVEITTDVTPRPYRDAGGKLIRPEAVSVTEWVEITIDWNWLAAQIGEAAVRNITKKSSAMAGAVTAKVLKGKAAK